MNYISILIYADEMRHTYLGGRGGCRCDNAGHEDDVGGVDR